MISRTVHELSALTNKPKKQTHTQTDTDTTEHNAYHLATLSLSCVLAKMFHDTTLQQWHCILSLHIKLIVIQPFSSNILLHNDLKLLQTIESVIFSHKRVHFSLGVECDKIKPSCDAAPPAEWGLNGFIAHNKVVLRELTLDGATQFVDEPVQFHFVYSLGTLGMWNADSDPHEFEYLRIFFRKFSLQSSFIDPCLYSYWAFNNGGSMLWPGWEGSVGPRGTKCRPNSQNFGSDFTPLYPAFGLPRDLLLRHGGWWSNVIVCLSVSPSVCHSRTRKRTSTKHRRYGTGKGWPTV